MTNSPLNGASVGTCTRSTSRVSRPRRESKRSGTNKEILILAGPNSAGKTTFAREFLPDEARCPIFVNADLIAAGLSPFKPENAALRAGRLMVQLIAEHVARGDSFAFETTLADRGYARHILNGRRPGTT